MVRKYQNKPIEIEAIRFEPTEECLRELTEWGLEPNMDYSLPGMPVLRVPTLKGPMIATDGDYIIKDNLFGFYVNRADDFHSVYKNSVKSNNLPKDKKELLAIFERYNFRDEYGYKLENCLEFIELLDFYCGE